MARVMPWPPAQEAMQDDASSYSSKSASIFARLIRKGSFQFIKGTYFEDCWRDRKPFQMRQKIPREYLWDCEELMMLWEKHGARFMLSISYAWLSEDHPDPDMFHLVRLAKLVSGFKRFHRTRTRTGVGQKIDQPILCADCDCAVFLDFCSLWQKDLIDGIDVRTPEQIQQFKEGLTEINTPYGHIEISSARLEAVPSGTIRTYFMRGWTEFERTIIDSKAGSFRFLTTIVMGENFPVGCTDEEMESLFSFDGDCKKGPPITPNQFYRKLDQLQETAQGLGVRLFTNGSADMDLVKKKYADSFAMITRGDSLQCHADHWSANDFDSLVEALPHFANLKEFGLHKFELSTENAQSLARALAQCPKLDNVHFQENGLSWVGHFALFKQWRARQTCYACFDCSCCCCCPSCWCLCAACG
jgi:hypothetical protein